MIKKDYKKIDESVDLSFVNNDLVHLSNKDLIFDILTNSFLYSLPSLILTGAITVSLLTISHFTYTTSELNTIDTDLKQSLNNFNLLALGILYITIFGFSFLIGSLKPFEYAGYSLFCRQRGFLEIYEDTKKMILIITLVIILPLSLLSYEILKFMFQYNIDTLDLYRLYKEFIVFSPVFLLFMGFIHLNFKTMLIANMHKELVIYGGIYFKLFGFSYLIFVYLLKLNIFGITCGLISNSIITYFLTQYSIKRNIESLSDSYYFKIFRNSNFAIPKINDYIKETLFSGLYDNLNFAAFGITVLVSLFLSEYEFAANVIIFNLLSLIRCLCFGLSSTFKTYVGVHSLQHSLLSKKKFLRLFTLVFLSLAVIFSILILTLQYQICLIYFYKETPNFDLIKHEVSSVLRYYSIVIFIDYTAIVSDGFIQGVNPSLNITLIKGLFKLLIFAPLGLLICYFLNYDLIGFYIIVYTYMLIHAIGNIFYIYENHDLWIIRT